MNKFKIGSRTIKTGIAITLALGICHALNIEPAIFAAVSAIVNLQPTVYQSYINALQQIGITVIGVMVGLTLALTIGNSAIVVGVSSIIVILIALRLRWNSVILIGLVTVIFIIDTQGDFYLENTIARVSVILIGLVVALAVNVVLAPTDYRKFTLEKLKQFHIDVTNIFHRKILDFIYMRKSSEQDDKNLIKLLEQTESLRASLDIYKNEIRVLPYSTQAKELVDSVSLLEELYRYDEQLLHKILLIQDFEKERLNRLAIRDVKNYSDSFQQVINEISKGNEKILKNSHVLQQGILEQASLESWIDYDIADREVDEKLEGWYQKHGGNPYYMSALMEISIIVYEMRWIAREQTRIYDKVKTYK
ncbi:FUSC family protein [Desulfuribacillus alkaliarsenatis]|uniref:Uncharacterized protein n=1 Tax=Desulfuribacillus alkaliarsenatis TaxID=766136 RepID=A0A1E5G5X6_9FIRM|nr:aromatic acid exporter family protein [Desulfuribacillus alkaliarsenatis]OEF98580.1 hypothetical protein BHF68_02650 [Desulfuribacillus alkaliarsenatis]